VVISIAASESPRALLAQTPHLSGRRRRLAFAGLQGGPAPGAILNTEIEKLIAAIKSAAPNLSDGNAEQIAFGTVSEWIMRCPLDFPPNAS
jgi:hypothetical protein